MKYDHRVKVDGKWFDAGVEVNSSTSVNSEPPKNEPPKNDNTQVPENTQNNDDVNAEPPKNDDGENDETPSYTRTEVQQMNKEKLIEVATSLGFEVNEDNKVNDLKGMIIGKLGI